MRYLLYKITNLLDGNIYVGVHKTIDVNDGYMGSGKRINNAIKKYGVENFEKEILQEYSSEQEMYTAESAVVNEEFINHSSTYNIRTGGKGGFSREECLIGTLKMNQNLELRKRNSTRMKKLQAEGFFDESNKRFFEAGKCSFKGKAHTEETKVQIGAKNSENQKGQKNSQYGTCWITNGLETIKIKKSEPLPRGFKYGRK